MTAASEEKAWSREIIVSETSTDVKILFPCSVRPKWQWFVHDAEALLKVKNEMAKAYLAKLRSSPMSL